MITNANTPTSSFDRRSFIGILVAAGVMAAGTEITDASAASDHPDAELIELGERLELQQETLRACGARSDAAYEGLPEEPDLPLVCRMIDGDTCMWSMNTALAAPNDQGGVAYYAWHRAEPFRDYLTNTAPLATPLAYFRSRAAEIIAALDARDAAIKRQKDDAGVTQADIAEKAARATLNATIRQIADIPARTMVGLLVKVRAETYDLHDPRDGVGDYIGDAEAVFATARAKNDLHTTIRASLTLDLLSLAFPSAPVAA